jgi:hypothetical protein
MAVVPRPNSGAERVSHGGRLPFIDGNKLAAPGLAAADMLSTGLQEGADFVIRKRKAKEKAAENLYQSSLTLAKIGIDKDFSSTNKLFDQEGDSAELKEIGELGQTLGDAYKDRVEEAIKDLRPEDQDFYRKRAEHDIAEFNETVFRKISDRTFAVEVEGAKDIIENNILDGGERAEAAVADGVALLDKHLPKETVDAIVGELTSQAMYSDLTEQLRVAENMDDVTELQNQIKELENDFKPGTQHALNNEARGALNRIVTDHARIQKDFQSASARGEPIDPIRAKEAIDSGAVSQEQVDQWNTDALNVQNHRADVEVARAYKTEEWPSVRKQIRKLFETMDSSNPGVSQKNFAKAEDLIDKSTDSPAARTEAKVKLAGMLSTTLAEAGDDRSWFQNWFGTANNMGDSLEDLKDPESAREHMRQSLNAMQTHMIKTGKDLDLSDLYTKAEEQILMMHRNAELAGKSVTIIEIDQLNNKLLDMQVDQLVADHFANDVTETAEPNPEAEAWLKANPDHPDAPAVRAKLGL